MIIILCQYLLLHSVRWMLLKLLAITILMLLIMIIINRGLLCTCRQDGEDTGLQLFSKSVEAETEEGAVVKLSLWKNINDNLTIN